MNIEIVSASAGTGKTEYLSQKVLEALTSTPPQARIERVLAVTYTRKAEGELRSRIRRKLISHGDHDSAQRVPLAYIGTVHSVCMRLLTENAILAGLSPSIEVLPEDGAETELARALELALDFEQQRRFEEICQRIRPNWNARNNRYHWLADAADLIELARSNGVAPDRLGGMARRSIDSFFKLLPDPLDDTVDLDAQLASAVERSLDLLVGTADDRKNTQGTIEKLHEARRALRSGTELPWVEWVQLTKLAPAKAHDELVHEVRDIAKRHTQHRRFRSDLESYVTTIYDVVAKGLDAYSRWKAERRLVDFVDMEERALSLLERPEVVERLSDELDLVVIDEFQDTSPIQLEMFVRLQSLARRSIWVGDRKQSIFAFRGADPELMDAVIASVERSGRAPVVLERNHRSREPLVDFVSDYFVPSFTRHGYAENQVRVQGIRIDRGELSRVPPVGVWRLESKSQEEDAVAIARGIARVLSRAQDTHIEDLLTKQIRPVAPADIAVLAVTNDETHKIANALDVLGIPSAVRRAGLLTTPEGTLVEAILRVVIDPWDHSAIAEIDALTAFDGRTPDEWLTARLEEYASERGRPEPTALARRVLQLRESLVLLSPTEAMNRIVDDLALCTICARWPRQAQRLANLDAFQGLAKRYEEYCRYTREAASLFGFVHFARSRQADGEDEQHAIGEAVQICTYHRAKGAEWPIVVLSSLDTKSRSYGVTPDAAPARLDRKLRHRVFSASPDSDAASFDVQHPLAGRWLRFWPWPYTTHQKTELSNAATQTDEARRVVEAEMRESLRLLYVGFTRARDQLILTARKDKEGKLKAGWLEALPELYSALCELPVSDVEHHGVVTPRGRSVATHVWSLDGAITEENQHRSDNHVEFAALSRSERPSVAYRIAPSRASVEWPDLPMPLALPPSQLHGRVAFNLGEVGADDAGTIIHKFLAGDRYDLPANVRVGRARDLLLVHSASALMRPEDLVAISDSLRAFLDERWPRATWHREIPVAGAFDTPAGIRRVEGQIDLLLETKDGWVIIDHKSTRESDPVTCAHEFGPQIAGYREVLTMHGDRVLACLVHLSITGSVVELSFDG